MAPDKGTSEPRTSTLLPHGPGTQTCRGWQLKLGRHRPMWARHVRPETALTVGRNNSTSLGLASLPAPESWRIFHTHTRARAQIGTHFRIQTLTKMSPRWASTFVAPCMEAHQTGLPDRRAEQRFLHRVVRLCLGTGSIICPATVWAWRRGGCFCPPWLGEFGWVWGETHRRPRLAFLFFFNRAQLAPPKVRAGKLGKKVVGQKSWRLWGKS